MDMFFLGGGGTNQSPQSMNQPINQATNQSINGHILWGDTNQSIKQPINQSTQSINFINQSINQSTSQVVFAQNRVPLIIMTLNGAARKIMFWSL